jgi:hypothetical protein
MTTLIDCRYEALIALGHTGSTTDMMMDWLFDNGGTGATKLDRWETMLTSQGFPYGSRDDSWFALLGILGHDGHINDREMLFWCEDEGIITLPPANILVNTQFVTLIDELGEPLTHDQGPMPVIYQDYMPYRSDSIIINSVINTTAYEDVVSITTDLLPAGDYIITVSAIFHFFNKEEALEYIFTSTLGLDSPILSKSGDNVNNENTHEDFSYSFPYTSAIPFIFDMLFQARLADGGSDDVVIPSANIMIQRVS